MRPAGSDASVLAASVEDPECFSVLWERHCVVVGRYLARRVGGDLAEDLTAEVFVRGFRARGAYRAEGDSALPWLLGIASHLVGDHRRAERRRFKALELLAAAPDGVVPDSAGLAPGLISELRRLPQVDRDTLLLVVWGELTYEEAAGALGVPVGTVRSRIARARGRLITRLGSVEAGEPDAPAPVDLGGDRRG